MTADRMTEEEARERLAFYATFSDAVDQIVNAHDALAVLVDPAEMGARWTPEQLTECLRGAEEPATGTLAVSREAGQS